MDPLIIRKYHLERKTIIDRMTILKELDFKLKNRKH